MLFTPAAILLLATGAFAMPSATPTTESNSSAVLHARTGVASGWSYRCYTCFQARYDDALEAINDIPSSGESSGNNDQTWTVSSATVEWDANGDGADYNYIYYGADIILSNCFNGQTQGAGIAYNTGTNDDLGDGCVCVHNSANSPCICGAGTPAFTCGDGDEY